MKRTRKIKKIRKKKIAMKQRKKIKKKIIERIGKRKKRGKKS